MPPISQRQANASLKPASSSRPSYIEIILIYRHLSHAHFRRTLGRSQSLPAGRASSRLSPVHRPRGDRSAFQRSISTFSSFYPPPRDLSNRPTGPLPPFHAGNSARLSRPHQKTDRIRTHLIRSVLFFSGTGSLHLVLPTHPSPCLPSLSSPGRSSAPALHR